MHGAPTINILRKKTREQTCNWKDECGAWGQIKCTRPARSLTAGEQQYLQASGPGAPGARVPATADSPVGASSRFSGL